MNFEFNLAILELFRDFGRFSPNIVKSGKLANECVEERIAEYVARINNLGAKYGDYCVEAWVRGNLNNVIREKFNAYPIFAALVRVFLCSACYGNRVAIEDGLLNGEWKCIAPNVRFHLRSLERKGYIRQ
jgi:hypothetical protein